MSNHQVGHDAEKYAAEWLKARGFTVVELNWRTRQCEIDIVVRKKKIMYLVEVKSRASAVWGGGMDYITPKKLEQMKFAAELWTATNKWPHDIRLAALAVDGHDISFVEILD